MRLADAIAVERGRPVLRDDSVLLGMEPVGTFDEFNAAFMPLDIGLGGPTTATYTSVEMVRPEGGFADRSPRCPIPTTAPCWPWHGSCSAATPPPSFASGRHWPRRYGCSSTTTSRRVAWSHGTNVGGSSWSPGRRSGRDVGPRRDRAGGRRGGVGADRRAGLPVRTPASPRTLGLHTADDGSTLLVSATTDEPVAGSACASRTSTSSVP